MSTSKQKRDQKRREIEEKSRIDRELKREERRKKAQKRLDDVKQSAFLATLVPFRPIMARMLAKRGFPTKGKRMKDIVSMFAKEIMKKPDFAQGILQSKFDSMTKEDLDNFENFDPATIGVIVTEIYKFVKNAINKNKDKKSGKPVELTEEEKEIAEEAEKETDLDEKERDAVSEAQKKVDEAIEKIEEAETRAQVGAIVLDWGWVAGILFLAMLSIIAYNAIKK